MAKQTSRHQSTFYFDLSTFYFPRALPRRLRRFYQNDRPTKNALEKKWVDSTGEKLGQPSDLALLRKTFDRMK
jgi:hypothetical protein